MDRYRHVKVSPNLAFSREEKPVYFGEIFSGKIDGFFHEMLEQISSTDIVIYQFYSIHHCTVLYNSRASTHALLEHAHSADSCRYFLPLPALLCPARAGGGAKEVLLGRGNLS